VKLPGIGEVKKPVLYGVGGAVVLVGGYVYYKRRKANSMAAQTTDTSGTDPNAVDPTTGLPYSQESGVYGFGGTDPATGVPYIYENQPGGTVTNAGSSITTNSAWLSQAQQDAQNLFGATYAMTTTALGKYIAQSPKGLNDDEYQLVSEVVAELGQPPEHGPYRLIHAPQTAPIPTPPGPPPPVPVPSPTPPPPVVGGRTTKVTVVPFGNPAPWNSTMWGIADHYGISLQSLEAANPNVKGPSYIIHPGQQITVPLS